jgi:hypothetical protein
LSGVNLNATGAAPLALNFTLIFMSPVGDHSAEAALYVPARLATSRPLMLP